MASATSGLTHQLPGGHWFGYVRDDVVKTFGVIAFLRCFIGKAETETAADRLEPLLGSNACCKSG